MALRISYERADGVWQVVIAAPKENISAALGRDLSEEEYRQFVFDKSIPAGATKIHELPDDWIPPDVDRMFLNAWVTDGETVSVDMKKAREVHKDVLRGMRAPLLVAADVEMSKAYKDPVLQDEIEAKRQALRDVTAHPGIEVAATPDALRAAIPPILLLKG